ncbi:hypothetical protein GCM10027036_23600 [Flavihumibacter cheonanensis]|uniref:hypothetical protein n=1 Tax=Flavihumibacter cheonanensis TaxID=1442385 RepID=UPI001EF95902|nr:hypothetical protein [Flavihumibacter cheonanensis]MCG7754487.1 hypothetical protein [Flavihumibacter cheonanensis]
MKLNRKLSFYYLQFLLLMSLFSCSDGTDVSRQQTFRQVLGDYRLDLSRTKLSDGYINDSDVYKNLILTFYSDSTFRMNFEVPFLYDTSGRWKAGTINEWCWILFDSFKYINENNYSGSQFTRPFQENGDTLILINAATPRKNQQTLSDIYFKKIKSNAEL